jgi:hypothetical protein
VRPLGRLLLLGRLADLDFPSSTVRPWIGSEGWEKIVDGFRPKCTQGWGMVRFYRSSFARRSALTLPPLPQSILQLQIWTAIIELGCGPLSGRRFPYKDDITAYEGWNADLAQSGAQLELKN